MERKKKSKIRDLTGRIFKTVDSSYSSRNNTETFSSRLQTSYLLTGSDVKTEKSYLDTIRSRTALNNIEKASQKSVSKSLKDSVIPLFNQHNQLKSRMKRRKELGLRNLSVDSRDKTLLDELLLSGQLQSKLESLEQQVKECDDKIAVACNNQFIAEGEVQRLKNELIDEKSLNIFLKNSLSHVESKYHYYKNSFGFVERSRNHYKLALDELRHKFDDLNRELHAEKLLNDIR
jgi:hypothetical protein